MTKTIHKTKQELQELLATAEDAMSRLTEMLSEGDLNEEEFKTAVNGAMRMTVAKAAITSLNVMRGTA